MNNRYISVIAATLLATPVSLFSQNSFDAAMLVNSELNGTARYVSMAGAMGALGSDISVINQNPAGIGTYHQSDMNVSFSINDARVTTNPEYSASNMGTKGIYEYYSHNRISDLKGSFDNLSVVMSGYDGESIYANFAVSYRKTQNKDYDLDYIDQFPDADGYQVFREFRDHRRQEVSEFDLNMSFNIEDRLYLGMTMGILSTDIWSDGYFFDYYDEGAHPDYPDGFDYTCADKSNFQKGNGFNMSFGAILRPIPTLRLGVALKTPTWFSQSIEYGDNMYALKGEQKDGSHFSNGTEYKFASPWSASLSLGYTVGKTAIGLEMERFYTSRAFLTEKGTRLDRQGAEQYRNYSTIRIGAEHNIGKFSLRAGACRTGGMLSNWAQPIMTDNDFNDSRLDFQTVRPTNTNNLTCGLGYCSAADEFGDQFYIDLAYVHSKQNVEVSANEYYEDPTVYYRLLSNKLLLTVGWNF